MPHLVKWNDELKDYGLVTLGSHVQNATKEQIRAKASSLGVTFTVASQARVKDGDDFRGIPHCMLFDHTGKCVYRGHPMQAEREIRAALGKALADGIDKPSKSVAPIVTALAKGDSPAQVLPKLLPLLKSSDAKAAEEAKMLVDNMTAGAIKRVEEADAKKSDDPVAAYLLVERVPTTFRGTPVATQATALLTELKKDKAVQNEVRARLTLESVRKLDNSLSQAADRANVDDLKDAKFHKANATNIDQLKRALQSLQKAYPEAKATEEASAIGEKYGVTK